MLIIDVTKLLAPWDKNDPLRDLGRLATEATGQGLELLLVSQDLDT